MFGLNVWGFGLNVWGFGLGVWFECLGVWFGGLVAQQYLLWATNADSAAKET